MERRRQVDDRAQFRFDLGRIFLRHNPSVQAESHAIRHHIGVDSARYETDRHLRRAYPGHRRGPRLKADPPFIKSGQDCVRRFKGVDAGRGPGGVRRAAKDLDLQVKRAIMRVHHRVREASADRQIWLREALLEQITRANLAARLFVVGNVQFDCSIERRAAFFEGQHGEGVSRNVRLRHGGSAPDHPIVDDLGAVWVVRPARTRRHHVAMRVERDRRAPAGIGA